MGINCLLQYLKLKHSVEMKNICEFRGKCAAVDASCWIHKALYLSLKRQDDRERVPTIFKDYIDLLKSAGVEPYVVFDGLKLPAKAAENERRARQREKATEAANSASILYADVVNCIKVCISAKVRYLVSPYEADAQIAYLMRSRYVDFVISEDSDLLAYGCSELIAKLDRSGNGEYYKMGAILSDMKLSQSTFLDGCIIAGCDFLKNPPRVGINKAFDMVRQSSIDEILQKISDTDPEYPSTFRRAKSVFLHQTVIDPETRITRPLGRWETSPQKLQELCGSLLSQEYASALSNGNVNVNNGQHCISISHRKESESQSTSNGLSQTSSSVDASVLTSFDAAPCRTPDDFEGLHTIPFKIMGSCYSTSRQTALEHCYKCLYSLKQPVHVQLKPEPENIHDRHSIAVYFQTDQFSEKVGYITKELTQHVHPFLNDPTLQASVKCIRFRTTFMRLGFYGSIFLTKRGLWHRDVEKASKSVK